MAQRGGGGRGGSSGIDPHFDEWKFNDQTTLGSRGSLGNFNFGKYAGGGSGRERQIGSGMVGLPIPGGGYVTDKGTSMVPHRPDVSPPKVIETVRKPDRPQKDDINPALAFAGPVAKKPTKSVNAISEFLRKKPVVARRQPGTRGVSLTSMAGGNGIGQNPSYRNTPGSQTYGIYPQTGSQQDYSLHYPNSYTYKPSNY